MDFMEGQCTENDESIQSYVIHLMHRYSSINFKKFQELGIHPGQFPVLGTVSRREGISLRELADFLHIKPPTVTVTVQRLEKAGLVCKKADPEDQRILRIYLTEKGKGIRQEMACLLAENEKKLTQGFSEEELIQLRKFLGRMTENLIQK